MQRRVLSTLVPHFEWCLSHLCNDTPWHQRQFYSTALGAYSTVLAAVANRELLTIAYVGIGAVLGLLLFSKGLKYIFERFYNPTIALLSGFLLGSLNKLWPWKETLETFIKHPGTEKEEIVALSVRNLAPEAIGLRQ